MALDGFGVSSWSIPSKFRVYDIGFGLVPNSENKATSMVVSLKNQKVFYTHDPSRTQRYGMLFAHSFSASSAKPTENVFFKKAGQLAYDWLADNLYLVDQSLGRILVISGPNFDKSTAIVNHDLLLPLGVAVDPSKKMLFYNDNDPSNVRIMKCDLDGQNGVPIVTEDIYEVVSLAADFYSAFLYFADASYNFIHAVDYFGSKR